MTCTACQGELGERDLAVLRHYGLGHRCGVVAWAGLDWHGVPFPLRLLSVQRMHANLRRRGIRARGRRAMLQLFAGCGCSVRLKAAWLAVKARVRAIPLPRFAAPKRST